jgi:hypothetical protein
MVPHGHFIILKITCLMGLLYLYLYMFERIVYRRILGPVNKNEKEKFEVIN